MIFLTVQSVSFEKIFFEILHCTLAQPIVKEELDTTMIRSRKKWNIPVKSGVKKSNHTTGPDTIFIQIYMDTSPGVPGGSKEPEGHKDQYLDVFLR